MLNTSIQVSRLFKILSIHLWILRRTLVGNLRSFYISNNKITSSLSSEILIYQITQRRSFKISVTIVSLVFIGSKSRSESKSRILTSLSPFWSNEPCRFPFSDRLYITVGGRRRAFSLVSINARSEKPQWLWQCARPT